ncbi:MAG: WYL domain-containing protein [Acidimicrobiales bacterium]
MTALHLAASAIRLEGIEGSGGLLKLGGHPIGDVEPADAVGVTDLPADDRLVRLFEAVTERRRATFAYGGVDRVLDPYRLDCTRGRWYVTGHDHTRDAGRNFRVERIAGPVTTGEPGAFARPGKAVAGVHMEPWAYGQGQSIPARVLIDAGYGPAATEVAPGATVVEERADGSVVLELAVIDVDAFRSFVLGFLEHAEVLAPRELRDDVVAWLTAAAGAPA